MLVGAIQGLANELLGEKFLIDFRADRSGGFPMVIC